jgi:hypothetical protein
LGDDILMDMVSRKKLFRAVTEAMINVGQHAYPIENRYPTSIRGRWWLAGAVDQHADSLMVMFCDLGVSIPHTLPKLYASETIGACLSLLPGLNPNDGELIRAGMTLGRSQTRETNRGKGLNDLRSFVDQSGSGELHIHSRYGSYCYRALEKEQTENYDTAIGGTFIRWNVPLSTVTNWAPYDDC